MGSKVREIVSVDVTCLLYGFGYLRKYARETVEKGWS